MLSTVSTVKFSNELQKSLNIFFYCNYRPWQVQAKAISLSGFVTEFCNKDYGRGGGGGGANQPPKIPVTEYVHLHHSIIHFCTDRFDKLKYVSNIFFKNNYFLGKVAGEFSKTNRNLDIKILDYSLSQHLKEINNYFLWEWGRRRGGGGTIFSSQWEQLFLPWGFDSFTAL